MKTLRWFAIVTLIAGASLIACGDDDDDGGSSGSAGSTAGSGGATGGTGGGAGTAGSGGGAGTAGSGGGETGGTGGGATGGSAGEAGSGGGAGEAGSGGAAGSAGGGGGPMDDPCIQACVANDQAGWAALIDLMAPCVCDDSLCATECETTVCAEPIDYNPTPECGNCALSNGQTSCGSELTACFTDAVCGPFVQCLLGCQ